MKNNSQKKSVLILTGFTMRAAFMSLVVPLLFSDGLDESLQETLIIVGVTMVVVTVINFNRTNTM